MSMFLSSLLLIVLFGLSLFLFFLIPFKSKKFQIIFVSILGGFILLMMFIPSSWICSIHLPIINSTITEFVTDFLNATQSFKDVAELAPSIKEGVIVHVQDIVKASFVFIVVSISLLIATIVSFIVILCHKQKKVKRLSLTTFATLVMSVIIMIVPMFNVYVLVDAAHKAVGTDEEALYESYPEYKKYAAIFDLVENIGVIDSETFLSDIPVGLMSVYSLGSEKELLEHLDMVDPLLERLDETGVTIIYKDENFDFSDTDKNTFKFDKIKSVVKTVDDSPLFNDAARGFANQIMDELEKVLQKDYEKLGAIVNKDVSLRFTKEEFSSQYIQLIDMLKFAADADLAHLLNLDIDSLKTSVADLIAGSLKNASALASIVKCPLLQKLTKHGGLVGAVEDTVMAVIICIRLYTALNNWLANFKTTSLHETCTKFLTLKGMI